MSKFISAPDTLIAAAVKISCERLSLADSLQLAAQNNIADEWALQVHINISLCHKSRKLPRYIEPAFFGNLALDELRPCRLCGTQTAPPRQTWHTDCWNALYKYGAFSWREAAKAKARSRAMCAICTHVRATEADHIVPIGCGGAPLPYNQQMLCANCHLQKTALDMQTIRKFKDEPSQFPIWYNLVLAAADCSPRSPV